MMDLSKKNEATKDVIYIVDKFKKNDKARSVMLKAMMEDETVRLASQENSRNYLIKKEEDNRTPFWMFCVLYFVLGIIFMISIENITLGFDEIKVFWDALKIAK